MHLHEQMSDWLRHWFSLVDKAAKTTFDVLI